MGFLPQTNGRTDGRDRSHETPLTLHICCLPVSLSMSAMILRQAMCPSSPRDLSLELTYSCTRQHGRAAPVGTELPRFCAAASSSAAADPGSRWLDDHEGHGERHLPVVVFVMRSSSRRLPRPRPWKWRYQVSAQVTLNERTDEQTV